MPAPLAKGLIIFASILTAAGIALYEDPYIREWIDSQRRRIAVALHSLGDGLDAPSPSSDDPDMAEAQRRSMQTAAEEQARRDARAHIVARNRAELVRRAREDGVAVDLDELARIGAESEEEAGVRLVKALSARDRSDKARSFDELVAADGTLRAETTAAEAPGAGAAAQGAQLRQRGAGARGLASGAAFANPFADEEVLFDAREGGTAAGGEKPAVHDSLYSLDTLDEKAAAAARVEEQQPLVDTRESTLAPDPPTSTPEMAMLDVAASQSVRSFYSLPSSPSTMSHSSFVDDFEGQQDDDDEDDDDGIPTPSGTLTPVEEGFLTAASVVGSNADDVGDVDMLSDATSESGFSHLSGTQTPGSWTDVGSDDGILEQLPHVA